MRCNVLSKFLFLFIFVFSYTSQSICSRIPPQKESPSQQTTPKSRAYGLLFYFEGREIGPEPVLTWAKKNILQLKSALQKRIKGKEPKEVDEIMFASKVLCEEVYGCAQYVLANPDYNREALRKKLGYRDFSPPVMDHAEDVAQETRKKARAYLKEEPLKRTFDQSLSSLLAFSLVTYIEEKEKFGWWVHRAAVFEHEQQKENFEALKSKGDSDEG